MHSSAREERRMFSFDEELAMEGKVGMVPVYHVGRGGAGNKVVGNEEGEEGRRGSGSGSSGGEGKRGGLEWLTRGLGRKG